MRSYILDKIGWLWIKRVDGGFLVGYNGIKMGKSGDNLELWIIR
jgi:hypothetical protein